MKKHQRSMVIHTLLCGTFLWAGGSASTLKIVQYNWIIENEDPRFSAMKLDVDLLKSSFTPYNWFTGRPMDQYNFPFLLFPLPLIDLPFSIVIDVLMYPIDKHYYAQKINRKSIAIKYWEDVLIHGKKINLKKAMLYIDYLDAIPDSYFIQENATPDFFNTVWDAAKSVNTSFTYQKLALIPRLHKEQYERLYNDNIIRGYYADVVANNLAKNLSTPKHLLQLIASEGHSISRRPDVHENARKTLEKIEGIKNIQPQPKE